MVNSAVNSAANNVMSNFNITPMNVNSGSGSGIMGYIGLLFVLVILGVIGYVIYIYQEQVGQLWSDIKSVFSAQSETPPAPTPTAPEQKKEGEAATAETEPTGGLPFDSKAVTNLEKILPGMKEVFNVNSNKFTYYDAAPLCKALGAELATYEQVKDAFSKGADWCNYGWTQGQMAVFPTQKETYDKLQQGPEEQRMTCGTVGVNGGYFDNPEMRFGVNCYGTKPSKSQHDAAELSKGAPLSPDALAFDKKVNQYKSEADSIGINPFNSSRW